MFILTETFIRCKKWIGWESYIDPKSIQQIQACSNKNRVLAISNHVSIVDFFHYIYIYRTYLPEHRIRFVTKSEFNSYPIVNDFINNLCFTFQASYEKDKQYIQQQFMDNENSTQKELLILFPEGKVLTFWNLLRSFKWTTKQNIHTHSNPGFTNVICPHTKGLYLLLKYFNPDCVLMNVLFFVDDIKEKHGKEFFDYLTGLLPQYSVIQTFSVPIKSQLDSILHSYNIDELFCDNETHTNNNTERVVLAEQEYNNIIYSLWNNIDNILTYQKKQYQDRKKYLRS